MPRLLSTHRESAVIELSRRLESVGRIENVDSSVAAALDHESIASAVFDGVTFPFARGRAVQKLSSPPACRGQAFAGRGCSPIVHNGRAVRALSETRNYLSLVLAFSSFTKDKLAFVIYAR